MKKDASVSGFNIGMNSGDTAGQTIDHAHVHLIPRRQGDVQDPRGGVRGVIPGKAAYWSAQGRRPVKRKRLRSHYKMQLRYSALA